MNISEMFSTTGSILFYGGIIGAAVSIVLGIIFIPLFSSEKKKINKKIGSEYKNTK